MRRFLVIAALLASCLAAPAARPGDVQPAAQPGDARAAVRETKQPVSPETWVDHDGLPIPPPKAREKGLGRQVFRDEVVEPISHAFDIPDKILWLARLMGADRGHYSQNVNAFDEVANSMWFTNRNHVRHLSAEEIRNGPMPGEEGPELGWTVTGRKKSGYHPGFVIKDAKGRKWMVKLDAPGHPQLESGADAIATRFVYAAGYNVAFDVPIKFRRGDLKIDKKLIEGKKDEPPFTDADLDTVLSYGHRDPDGTYYGQASLFVEGTPIGSIDMKGRRPDDPNDWFRHTDRRELRGLYVIFSWLDEWDAKDQQTLDMFRKTDGPRGNVTHYWLDLGNAFGSSAEGPKDPSYGFEHAFDWRWIGARLFTFGFVIEPWRRVKQGSDIPAIGNFESAVFDPNDFRPLIPEPQFRARTLRDDYWGAKIVASFSDDQIASAIDAAGYEDPRAKPYLLKILIERRDKIARYWFARVAPLDFFTVEGDQLLFRDLAVDRGLEAPRAYVVRITQGTGRGTTIDLSSPELPLSRLDGTSPAAPVARAVQASDPVTAEIGIKDRDARPVTVELSKENGTWRIRSIRHA